MKPNLTALSPPKARSLPARLGTSRSDQLPDGAAPLRTLRKSRGLSQAAVARALRTCQREVSRIEHREGLQVSTLRRYIEALGGELELTARFADQTFRVVPLVGDDVDAT